VQEKLVSKCKNFGARKIGVKDAKIKCKKCKNFGARKIGVKNAKILEQEKLV